MLCLTVTVNIALFAQLKLAARSIRMSLQDEYRDLRDAHRKNLRACMRGRVVWWRVEHDGGWGMNEGDNSHHDQLIMPRILPGFSLAIRTTQKLCESKGP